jgi:preprotein translocase subunit SecA
MFTLVTVKSFVTNPLNSIKMFLLERKCRAMSLKVNSEYEEWKEFFALRAANHFQLFKSVVDPKSLQFCLSVFLYSTDIKWIEHMIEELGEDGAVEWVANTLGVDKSIVETM